MTDAAPDLPCPHCGRPAPLVPRTAALFSKSELGRVRVCEHCRVMLLTAERVVCGTRPSPAPPPPKPPKPAARRKRTK